MWGRASGARVSWFNPLTGETRELGEMELRPWHGFTSPWRGSPSVLILEDARPPEE